GDVDGDEGDAVVGVLLPDVFEVLSLHTTRRAGGVPEVDVRDIAGDVSAGELVTVLCDSAEHDGIASILRRDLHHGTTCRDVAFVVAFEILLRDRVRRTRSQSDGEHRGERGSRQQARTKHILSLRRGFYGGSGRCTPRFAAR